MNDNVTAYEASLDKQDRREAFIEQELDGILEDLTNQLAAIMDLSQLTVQGESLEKLTGRSPHAPTKQSDLIDGLREHVCDAARAYLNERSDKIVDALERRGCK